MCVAILNGTDPSAPRMVRLSGTLLVWNIPERLYGETLLHFEVASSFTNTTNAVILVDITTETQYELPDEMLNRNVEQYLWVSVCGMR